MNTRKAILASAASGALALGVQHGAFGQTVLAPDFYVLTDSNGVAYNGKSFSAVEWEYNPRVIKMSGYFKVDKSGPGQISNFKFSLEESGFGINNYSSDDPNSSAKLTSATSSLYQGDIKASVYTPGAGRCGDCKFILPVQTTAEQGRGHIGGGSASLLYDINNFGLNVATYKTGQLIKASPNPIKTSGNSSNGTGFNNTTFLKAGIILPEFQGGTLTVDQDNTTSTKDFTFPKDGTIDGNGNDALFKGKFTGPGSLILTNSNRNNKKTTDLEIGSSSNHINLGNIISSRTNQGGYLSTTLAGETYVSSDTTINFGSVRAQNNFSTSNLTIKKSPSSTNSAPDFSFSPKNLNQKLTIRNSLSVDSGGVFSSAYNNLSTPGRDSEIQIKAGEINTSQGSIIYLMIPTVIESEMTSIVGGALSGSPNLKQFDNLGAFSKPITLKGTGEVIFSSSSSALLRSTTNQFRPSTAPDVLVQGKIRVNTNNFKISRYTVSPFKLDTANGNLAVDTTGVVSGIGTITANVWNEGSVSPGNSIGTLTVDGNYIQGLTNPNANLNIEVDGSASDLLKITGDNRTILLGGNLNISSYNNAAVSPGHVYTAIDVTGDNAAGGELGLTTKLNVVGSSGMKFVRETDREFRLLDPAYYATCTSNDPAVQVGCTKLQFAWLKVHPDTGVAVNPDRHKTPGQSTIKAIKQTGGALTTASSSNSSTNTNTCIANGGNAASCQQQNKTGSGSGAHNANSTNAAKTLDAGWASLGAAVSSGVTGGSAIGTTGYTTNQTSAALVTPDFANVIAAFFSIPTRIELNQALHSITAEPYASMQSVALEAMEQFGKNSLALTDRSVPLTHTQTFCKTDDGSLVPADSPERPDTCDAREKTVGSRWSLLLDGSNTEANLNGTSELASLDYNVFSTIYGLQYAFSPEWSAGAAFGYGQANLYNYEYANAHINADTYGGSIWGIYRPSADWKISGLLGYMNLQYDSTRQMAFGGLNRTANANWDGNGFTTALEAQYNWALNGDSSDPDAIRLKPRTFLSYAVHNQGSFSESGAQSLNLAIDSHTADSVLWGLGFTLETPIRLSSSNRIIPRFTVGYEHDFMGSADEEHQLTSSFSELPALGSIDVLGQNRGADALDLGLSIEIETSDSVSLYAAVNGGFWSNGTEISYGGGLKYAW